MRQRARSREDKESRREAILEAAREVWATSSFDELTMADVARRVQLAKGTLYLYFPTKETLLLALLESALERCLTEIEHRFSAGDAPDTPDEAALAITAPLLADEPLTRLLAILGTVLEHNVPQARIRQFKAWLLRRLERTGPCLERRLPFLGRGGGVRLLVRLHALVAGLAQVARPAPAVARVLASPGFEPFRIDFDGELHAMLAAILRGESAPVSTRPLSRVDRSRVDRRR
jgi:AcrR family transcriptional regulator